MKNGKEAIDILTTNVNILPRETRDRFFREENEIYHSAFLNEKKVFAALANGDADAFLNMSEYNFNIGNTTDDPLRTWKYASISFFALAARVCMENGMPEIEAYNYSDEFIRAIDKATKADEYICFYNIARDMVYRMKEIRTLGAGSAKLSGAIKYISEHLHSQLTREDIAAAAGLSPCYLSTCFKDELGISLSEYICRQKIYEAKILLKHTELTNSEIAYTLRFSSESYFGFCFKKYTGASPSKYKRSLAYVYSSYT